MTVISNKEFAINQDKYFDLAVDEQILIQKGDNLFYLIYKKSDDLNMYHDSNVYEEVLEPDDDLQRAISGEEFKKRCLKVIDKIFDK